MCFATMFRAKVFAENYFGLKYSFGLFINNIRINAIYNSNLGKLIFPNKLMTFALKIVAIHI